jgi:hypothetical protein
LAAFIDDVEKRTWFLFEVSRGAAGRDIEGKMRMNPPHQGEMPVVKSTDDARAGVTGHQVRYVLGFGLAGIVLAFLVLGVYFGLGGR